MLSKEKIKKSIIIGVLLIILILVGYYFLVKPKSVVNKNLNLNAESLEFKVIDNSLPDWKKNQYFDRFLLAKSKVKENPDDFNSWMELGAIYKGISDYQLAEKIWLYGGQIRPQNSISFNNLGDLYTRFLPDFTKAEQNYQIAIQNSKKEGFNILYYRNLYELYRYFFKERVELADDVLKQGIAANPQNVELVLLLANYYKEVGNKNEAKIYFQKALEINFDKSTEAEIKKELEALEK